MSSTKNWISENIRGGERISDETNQAIADFCVMWALFEGTELHDIDGATVDELQNVALRVAGSDPDIEAPLNFWKRRYIKEGKTNRKYEQLHFTHEPHKKLVSRVLLGEDINSATTILALLLIVYRLRNNLFHGMKDITRISDQTTNLDTGAKLLQIVLKVSGRYIFVNHAYKA